MTHVYYFLPIIDKLSHKLKLVKEVSLELSKGKDEKVVMWVLDSFSTLVSNALEDKESKNSQSKAAYAGVIVMLFNLNTSIIPIAVCSSATTAGALNESKQSYIIFIIVFHLNLNFTCSKSAYLGSNKSLVFPNCRGFWRT